MRAIFIFVCILLFVSCQNSDKSRIAHMIDEWDGKVLLDCMQPAPPVAAFDKEVIEIGRAHV